jgi:hypothetical protein
LALTASTTAAASAAATAGPAEGGALSWSSHDEFDQFPLAGVHAALAFTGLTSDLL